MSSRVDKGEWVVAASAPGHRDPLSNRIDIYIANKSRYVGTGVQLAVCKELTFKEVKEGCAPQPTLCLEPQSAQDLCLALLEALRQVGIVPWATGEGESVAVRRHLEDMRRLVFQGGEA